VSDPSERAVLAQQTGLNHAVRINGNYLYASNGTTVFRWAYTAGDRSDLGDAEIVVDGIPCCQNHVTRSLAFDKNNFLYVQCGSSSNVDPDALHARIKQFDVSGDIPAGGLSWDSGYLFANGLRNEVGIRFDNSWNLWGVENGVDNEFRVGM
jgi:glucose/arabinose dehydrogenase